jgi:single-strand DNA-binding protein
MNALIVTGRIGTDLEVRSTTGGKKVASFRFAVDNGKDKQGNKQTLWLTATLWEPREALLPHLVKGAQLALQGRLEVEEWEDKQGAKRQTNKIVISTLDLIGDKREGGETEAPPAKTNKSNKSTRGDNDVPF